MPTHEPKKYRGEQLQPEKIQIQEVGDIML